MKRVKQPNHQEPSPVAAKPNQKEPSPVVAPWLQHNGRGFTLMELLLVIAILGILLSIAVPLLTTQIIFAEKRAIEANVKILQGAVDIFVAENRNLSKDAESLEKAGLRGDNQLLNQDVLIQAGLLNEEISYVRQSAGGAADDSEKYKIKDNGTVYCPDIED